MIEDQHQHRGVHPRIVRMVTKSFAQGMAADLARDREIRAGVLNDPECLRAAQRPARHPSLKQEIRRLAFPQSFHI